jgi:hypothetical protein
MSDYVRFRIPHPADPWKPSWYRFSRGHDLCWKQSLKLLDEWLAKYPGNTGLQDFRLRLLKDVEYYWLTCAKYKQAIDRAVESYSLPLRMVPPEESRRNQQAREEDYAKLTIPGGKLPTKTLIRG